MKTVSILIGVLVLVAGSVYVVSPHHQTTQLIAERGEEEDDNETILVLAVKGEDDNETLMQLTVSAPSVISGGVRLFTSQKISA